MVLHVPQKIQHFWNLWNLRGTVLISLGLQIFLIFTASWRKRTGNIVITALIWSAYLLADWFAAFAVGLITSGLTECEKVVQTHYILAFWAPFLLLHLGGPDNITAFALEDNELWIRHLLGLVIEVLAVVYVFTQTLPNELTIPSLLVFLSGVIKYGERTRALYTASLSNFKDSMLPKPDPGPNYAQLMEELSGKQKAGVPVEIKTSDVSTFPGKKSVDDLDVSQRAIKPDLPELDETEIVQYGHKFFLIFKGLIVDLMLSFRERNESREFFLKRRVNEVFGVMEVELNLMYDVLYTKIGIVNNPLGYLLRFTSSGCIISSLVLYHLHVINSNGKQHKQIHIAATAATAPPPAPQPHTIHKFDNCVSYVLIAGALVLDAIALFKIIFSDWTVMQLQNATARSIVSKVQKYTTLDRYRRWSKRIRNHNLIGYCLRRRNMLLEKVANCFGVQEILDEILFATSVCFDNELRDFVFHELKAKAEKGEDIDKAKEIFNGRGDWVLSEAGLPHLLSSVDVEYDESLLLWHIATELCIQHDEKDHQDEINNQSRVSNQAPISRFAVYCLDFFREHKGPKDVEAPLTANQGSADVEAPPTAQQGSTDTEAPPTGKHRTTPLSCFVDYCINFFRKQKRPKDVETPLTANIGSTANEAPPTTNHGSTDTEAPPANNHGSKPMPCFANYCTNFFKKQKGSKDVQTPLTANLSSTDVEAPPTDNQGSKNVKTHPTVNQGSKNTEAPPTKTVADHKRFCKVLSEYMLYLLVLKPTMMSSVAGIGQIRYRDTCAELNRFIKGDHKEKVYSKTKYRDTCSRLLEIETKVEPSYVKGDKSKSVLFDACRLANKLREINKEKRWKIISQVWVEMMAYAASHCRANTHAQEISKGGQLVSFVWLLMAHFGLGEQFRIRAGAARAKLIVAK